MNERWSLSNTGNKFHILKNPGDPVNEGQSICSKSLKLYGTTGTTGKGMTSGMMCKHCLKLAGYHDHES